MTLEITEAQIEQLNDTDLRTLVAYLCERELRTQNQSPSAVTWGGNQTAPDGGIDVRVELPSDTVLKGYVPRASTGYQVKAQDMPRKAILDEIRPKGVVRPSISDLAAHGGSYIIVSSRGSVSDSSLAHRKAAMIEAIGDLPTSDSIFLDFYDRRRLASWINQHPGLQQWVRKKVGKSLTGWRGYDDWSSNPRDVEAAYLMDEQVRLLGSSISQGEGLKAERAIQHLRDVLSRPGGIVRLTGLSGVGKTRMVQALFDARVGADPLPWSDVLYTDVAEGPEPPPEEMLSTLVHENHRAVLIVDNCGADLHRRLVKRLANTEDPISLITVEYDIRDDDPPDTEVFRLEPGSQELIEKLIELQYPNIAAPSRRVIATFAEGNARVAFALAGTAARGDSLSQLNDQQLFERLFLQRKEADAGLLDAAKVCALLYSFEGEISSASPQELMVLGQLVNQSADTLYTHVAELQRRQLVQKRGPWRAILPHALANRLAKRAFEDLPKSRIEKSFVEEGSERMLKSFSRRVGFLHDNPSANAFAESWLKEDGLLGNLGRLPPLGEQIFENVAPVKPKDTLAFIERTAARQKDFFLTENFNKRSIIHVTRSLAYDAELFGRSASLLVQFALNETPATSGSAIEALKSLFSLYLSGTHATGPQRAAFVQDLLESKSTEKQAIGLQLLSVMLKSQFSSHFSFEFGARKRDFGWHPRNAEERRTWLRGTLGLIERSYTNTSCEALRPRLRGLFARSFANLVSIGLLDELIAIATVFASSEHWPEGWLGVRRALKRKLSVDEATALRAIEDRLAPRTLEDKVRTYVLAEQSTYDFMDANDLTDPVEAEQRFGALCHDLGAQLASQPELLSAMIPELLGLNQNTVVMLGKGLSRNSASLLPLWRQLLDSFTSTPRRSAAFLSGFLVGAMEHSTQEVEQMLDEALREPLLHPYLVALQVDVGFVGDAFPRLIQASDLITVPLESFKTLAYGKVHEALSDKKFSELIQKLLYKENALPVVTEVVGMRVISRRTNGVAISEELRALARAVLKKIEPPENEEQDYLIGHIVAIAFDQFEHEDQARALCARIARGIEPYGINAENLTETIRALIRSVPTVVLDEFVEAQEGKAIELNYFQKGNIPDPFDEIPEAIWIAWAAKKPEIRYELLAQFFNYSSVDTDTQLYAWSGVAMKLIEVSPDPLRLLDVFLERFHPHIYEGTYSQTLASRLSLFPPLKAHPKAEVAAWATTKEASYIAEVEEARIHDASRSRVRDQSFE